jgi:hypothetical protein
MMGALGILSAKTLARRCVGDPADSKDFVSFCRDFPVDGNDRRRLHDFVTRGRIFEWKFRYQVIAVSALIYLALLLFVSGLVILLLNDQRRIGYAVSALTAVIGVIFLVSVVHDLSTELKLKWNRGNSNICPTIFFWI